MPLRAKGTDSFARSYHASHCEAEVETWCHRLRRFLVHHRGDRHSGRPSVSRGTASHRRRSANSRHTARRRRDSSIRCFMLFDVLALAFAFGALRASFGSRSLRVAATTACRTRLPRVGGGPRRLGRGIARNAPTRNSRRPTPQHRTQGRDRPVASDRNCLRCLRVREAVPRLLVRHAGRRRAASALTVPLSVCLAANETTPRLGILERIGR